MSTAFVDLTERLAIGASAACLVHCLALPLLIAALPALSAVLAISENFHIWVLVFAVPAAGFSLVSGRARHGVLWPLAVGATGLMLLALGTLVLGETTWEVPVTVAGSLALATAHIVNWRLRRSCGC